MPRVQLHAVLPLAGIVPRNPYGPDDPRHFGWGTWRLEPRWPLFCNRTSPADRQLHDAGSADGQQQGLGIGRVWYKLPLWAYKDVGQWTFDGGGGYQVVHQSGFSSFPYGAFLAERKLGKPLELGAEIFQHGGEGGGTPHARTSTLLDGGGYYHFPKERWQFLFAYGHSVAGQSETYSYVALYYTWRQGQSGRSIGGRSTQHCPWAALH